MALIPYFARIQFEAGSRRLLAEELALLGVKRPLVVTDRGVVACGVLAQALESLPARPPVFDGVQPEPLVANVMEAVARYRGEACDGLVAVGGGAVIDTAKGVAVAATHPEPLERYRADPPPGAARSLPIGTTLAPLVAIATTAGTGSDLGRGAGIARAHGEPKMVLASQNLIPKVALCDPELTLGLPRVLTAGTGIDAFSHALEAFLAPTFNPMVDAIALDAMARLWRHLPQAVEAGTDRTARTEVMLGATSAGMCFWKGLGPAHALSIPLDTLGLHHGTLVGVLLPAMVRFAADAAPEKLVRLRTALGLDAGADVPAALAGFNRRIGLPSGLRAMGVDASHLPAAAEAAAASFFNRTAARIGTPADYLRMAEESMA